MLKENDLIVDFNNFDNFFKPKIKTVVESDQEVFALLNLHNFDAVVAGGAALSWYDNQPVGSKDIDIWCKDQKNQTALSQLFMEKGYRKSFDSDNAETYDIFVKDKHNYRIQIIKNRSYNTVEELIHSFDITVSQIATDGKTWWLGDNFIRDFKNRKLVLTKIHKTSIKRLIKYWIYGFQPDDIALQMIIDNPDSCWDFSTSTDEEYANAI